MDNVRCIVSIQSSYRLCKHHGYLNLFSHPSHICLEVYDQYPEQLPFVGTTSRLLQPHLSLSLSRICPEVYRQYPAATYGVKSLHGYSNLFSHLSRMYHVSQTFRWRFKPSHRKRQTLSRHPCRLQEARQRQYRS